MDLLLDVPQLHARLYTQLSGTTGYIRCLPFDKEQKVLKV